LLKPENRAVVFAHYDMHDMVDPYVYFYLRQLRKISNTLVFVSTAKLDRMDLDELALTGCEVILRENTGYDFMSYKRGLESLQHAAFDEIVICNDSVYGPFFDLQGIFSRMSSQPCDFWGMTSNTDISYHLQSYFVVFKRKALDSNAFSAFWQSVTNLDTKEEIIRRYEVGMTRCLLESGLKAATSAEYSPSLSERFIYLSKRFSKDKIFKKVQALAKGENVIPKINATHSFWKELILQGRMPFLKVEPLRDNPMKVDIDDYQNVIKSVSDYDVELIKKHLSRVAGQ
jgi:lipopolysaccharide biosynthesis protein